MKLEHIAIWAEDLEKMKDFYTEFFQMKCSEKYVNAQKGFSSYFLSFGTGARIEIMHRPDISKPLDNVGLVHGYTHLAISVGSIASVDQLTDLIQSKGFVVHGEPRTTGDGYYESVVLDPEGNLVEITE
jgi:lactoylglutathione lyase